MIVVEGGGASLSPKTFHDLLLPCMQDIFKPKKIPQVVYIFGSSKQIIEFLLACDPDGIILEKDCNLEQVGTILPATMPLFSECGGYRCGYCMSVCPAGEDVIGSYIEDKKGYVSTVVKPLKDKEDPVYVISGTDGESSVPKQFP